MDTRYVISNSKDQSIKLWDMRRFANESTIEKIRDLSNTNNDGWDYRSEIYGRRRKILFIFISKKIFFLFI